MFVCRLKTINLCAHLFLLVAFQFGKQNKQSVRDTNIERARVGERDRERQREGARARTEISNRSTLGDTHTVGQVVRTQLIVN